jgi:chemotaxis regulatin CheY-phosphate phosphatase CheZ
VTHSVAELIDMARALSEGDFDKQLDQDFNGELGQLASYLDAVRQTLQSLAAATTGSKDLLPKAADGVADINREAESGFNSVWEVVEEMQSNQAEIRSLLEACAVELKGSGATELQTILAKNRANLLALMSYLSFQDVLRQRLEKVQCIISMIEEKLLQLSVKFNLRSSEKLVREGDGAGLELAAR